MGTIKKGILGGFSGTVGTVVGANWRGMDVIRSRPKASSSNPTPQQLLQREKFALAIKFQNALRQMQSRLYGNNVGVKSRVNLAASYLLKEVVTVENGEAVIQMDKVLITKGDITGFENLTMTVGANQTLEFVWDDNSNQMQTQQGDIFCTAVFEEESGTFSVKEGPESRNLGAAAVSLPVNWTGKTVHTYAFFQNVEQTAACNSVYLGTAILT